MVLGASVSVAKVLVNSTVVSFPSRMVRNPVSWPLPSSPLLMLKAVVYLEPRSAPRCYIPKIPIAIRKNNCLVRRRKL